MDEELPEINPQTVYDGYVESDEPDYRAELIRLSNAGEISQSEKYLRKASNKVLAKIHRDYIIMQREKANILLTETLIDKFSTLLEAINMVDSGDNLREELNQDKLLKSDVKSAVETISPWIPYLGIFSGGVTVGKHVFNRTEPTVDRDSSGHESAEVSQQRQGISPTRKRDEAGKV
jgi:hypothetical protein